MSRIVGECFTCERINRCTETNEARVKADYTCPLFAPIEAPVYLARLEIVERFGYNRAVKTLLDRPPLEGEEDDKSD